MSKWLPVTSIFAAVVFLILGVILAIWGTSSHVAILMGLIVTTIPALIAAAYSERASRGVAENTVRLNKLTNGELTEQVRKTLDDYHQEVHARVREDFNLFETKDEDNGRSAL